MTVFPVRAGGATFIVTDDRRHLLPLKAIRVSGHRTIQVIGPAQFLRHLDAIRSGRP
jgi:predicted nucleic acid-binding protein